MKFIPSLVVSSVTLLAFAACGPAGRRDPGHGDDDDDGMGVDADIPTTGPEICDDALDNDGDGRADCADPDCSGVGTCPVCGSVENPQSQPLALPDGLNSGAACQTDTDCVGQSQNGVPTPNCIQALTIKECHASYTSTLHFVGFPAGAVLNDATKLLKICVNIEHSWLRDLQMELLTPPDSTGKPRVFFLDKFVDRSGGEIYLGQANDSDSAATPVPGVGADYCWTPNAAQQMVTSATVNGPTMDFNGSDELVPGDYKPASVWSALTGVPLNGDWTMRVTDLWGIDNGFIFHWSISFDPSLVSDCSGPIIL